MCTTGYVDRLLVDNVSIQPENEPSTGKKKPEIKGKNDVNAMEAESTRSSQAKTSPESLPQSTP